MVDFFTIPEYEQWLEEIHDAHKWDSKYYKVSGMSHNHGITLAFKPK
jgi:DNA topoisomerase-2